MITLTPQLKKTLWIWLGVILCLHVLSRLGAMVPDLQTVFVLMNAALLMYTPLLLNWKNQKRIAYLDWRWSQVVRDLLLYIVVSLMVFFPYALGAHFYETLLFGKSWQGLKLAGFWLYFFNQIVLVALPEEIFFRGFMEDALTQALPPKSKFLGAPFGWAMVVNGLIFAFSHSLIAFQWWHFSIFFPSLLFSWLRQKTKTIWVAALFHASCNCVAWLIINSYHA